MTQEQAQKIVDEVNRRLKPVEDAFMAYVDAYKVIGYGRMMQMIQVRWDAELKKDRNAHFSEGDGKGFTETVP